MSETTKPPFSADEIRAATPAGSKWAYEIRQARKPPATKVTIVEAATDADMTYVQTTYNAGGEVIGEPSRATSTWSELESHAKFPKAHTTIEAGTTETPIGTFEGWVVTVTVPDAGLERIQRFHFAKSMPGPPVLFEQTDDGEVVFRMVRIEVPPATLE